MDQLRQDLLYALRSLGRSRGFTTSVVLTLTIGIGALTAIFSVVNAVLLRPLPLRSPDRVVQIWSGAGTTPHGPTSAANFLDLRASVQSFDAMAAEDFGAFNLAGDENAPAQRLEGAIVSPSFFNAAGVSPVLGRAFAADDERPDARIAVLSHALWQQRFGADPHIVGRPVRLNNEAWEIVGVMPEGFDFPGSLVSQHIDLWVPLGWAPGRAERGIRELGITARLKPGLNARAAQRELDAVARRLAAAYPTDNSETAIRLVPLQEEMVGSSRRVLLVLLGSVALVLVIASANVANLSLARAQRKHREVVLRAALGASRSRLAQHLFTESLVLSIAGGALGLLLATWLTGLLVALGPEGLPRVHEIGIDSRVFLFAVGVSVLTAILCGAAPALSASSAHVGSQLRDSGRTTTEGHDRRQLRRGIVVLEIATALVLLVGAGLLLRSLQRLTSVNPGFDSNHVLVARVALDRATYDTPARQARYLESAITNLHAINGVAQVAAVDFLPFARSDAYLDVTIEDRAVAPGKEIAAHVRSVTSDYFDAMRIPRRAGRSFDATDREGAMPVGIVNLAMARRYWPELEPSAVVGRRVRMGNATTSPPSPWLTIVGVAGDVKHWSLSEQFAPELYFPLAQSASAQLNFVIRTDRGDETGLAFAGAIREALGTVDRNQPVSIEPLRDLVRASIAQPRFRGMLLGFFAGISLLLAVIGIYGVISYSVVQRTREIGVRLALGAQRTDILRLVLREGLLLTAAGVAGGLAASLWLTGLLRGMLFEVTPTDAMTFAAVPLLLAITAMVANLVPARSAARVDPLISMRAE